MNPVLVIKLSNTTSKEEIIAELRKGIIRNSRYYCDVLFVFSCDIDHLFYGILCEENSLEDGNNIYKLKETQSILGVYKFHWDNIIEIFDSQKRCNLNILAEHELMEIVCEVYIKDKQVAVNDIIKSHFTKAEYQKIYGGTRSDVQKAKSFFDKLLDKTILQEITTKVKVSEEEAKGLLQNACKQADANILNLDLENSVLLNIIQNDDTLRKRCELIIEENWKKNHNREIQNVIDEAKEIKSENRQLTEDKNRLLQETKRTNNELIIKTKELKELDKELDQKKELNENLKQEIKAKITEIRTNASEVLAEYGVYSSVINDSNITSSCDKKCYSLSSSILASEETLEHCESWKDNIRCLIMNLESLGADNSLTEMIACFIYSSVMNNKNLLICGPKSEDVASMISLSLFGYVAPILVCDGDYNVQAINDIKHSESSVIIVKNIFNSSWKDRFLVDVPQNKAFIFISPFYEDMSIEPAGLYNFMVPLLTETLLTEDRNDEIVAGTRTKYPEMLSGEKINTIVLKRVISGSYYLTKIINILSTTKALLSSIGTNYNADTVDIECYLCLLQYTAVTAKWRQMANIIGTEKPHISEHVLSNIQSFIGDFDYD